MLTKRQNDILIFIFENKRLKVKDLTLKFSISDKTVRNEVKSINASLGIDAIKSSNAGLEINESFLANISNLLKETEPEQDNINNEVLEKLLLSNEPLNFDETAESFFISPSTLNKRMKLINHEISSFHVEIKRKNNQLILVGEECNKRNLLVSLIYKESNSTFDNVDNLYLFFQNLDINHILTTVKSVISDYGFIIPDYYLSIFMINICTILSFELNSTEEKQTYEEHAIELNDYEMKIAYDILQQLHYPCTKELCSAIADSLIGIINHQRPSNKNLLSKLSPEFMETIQKHLKLTFAHFMIDVKFDDFLPVFLNHVYLMIQRTKNPNSAFLPQSFVSLKESCFYIYDIALYFCNQLEKEFHIEIKEPEISLISIHIGYAIEECYANKDKINIALITENYHIIDRYIIRKINEEYQNKVNLIKLTNISQLNLPNIDLFITTRVFDKIKGYNHCLISPFLTSDDKKSIQKSIIHAMDEKKNKKIEELMLRYFDPSLFFYSTSLKDKESVLDYLNMKLQLKGYVEEDYLEQILKRENLSPTCFLNEFAIPHPFECTAIQSKIAIYINPEKVQWTSTNSVQFVFLFAISKNDQQNLKYLFDAFANILCNESLIMKLRKVTTFDQFLELIDHSNLTSESHDIMI